MKNTSSILIILLALLFTLLKPSLNAQDNYWQGGTGSWHDAANWSLHQVPTADHNVWIGNNELVNVLSGQAYARRIYVQTGGTLHLRRPAILTVSTDQQYDAAIINQGLIRLKGKLYVMQESSNKQAYGIRNLGSIIEYRYGILDVQGFNYGLWNVSGSYTNQGRIYFSGHNKGMLLDASSSFSNYQYGRIYHADATYYALDIEAGASFENGGLMNFSGQVTNAQIRTLSNFTQWQDGEININSIGYNGIEINNQAQFTNHGEINISSSTSSGTGISITAGSFLNVAGGAININNAPQISYGIGLFAGATFENHGVILMEEAGKSGLYVYGNSNFTNYSVLTVRNSSSASLRVTSANFTNSGGKASFINDNYAVRSDYGNLENTDCGILQTNGTVYLRYADLTHLAGQWLASVPDFQLAYSSIVNESVIYDYNNAFSIIQPSNLTNEGLIIQPQNYAPQAGLTVSPVFMVHPWADEQVHPAWLHPTNNSLVLAAYDQVFNEVSFASSLPSGIDRMDILIQTADCGDYSSFVDFAQPSALNSDGISVISPGTLLNGGGSAIAVYPNPAHHQVNLSWNKAEADPVSFELFDIQGRQLRSWLAINADATSVGLDRPAELPAGTYLLIVRFDDGQLDRQRVVFQ